MGEYVKVGSLSSLPPGTGISVRAGQHVVAVFNVRGTLHALDDACSHRFASLAMGKIEDDGVLCPLHHAKFNFKTGANMSPPAETPVPVFNVRANGDDIEVEVP